MEPIEIPLFPLNIVLFPGMSLPMHIFEPRYKDMIHYCLQNESDFGILLSNEKDLCQVGCTAKISHIVRQYEDGRMDIVTEGQQRFHVLEFLQTNTYLEGVIEFFDDDSSEDLPDELLDNVLNAYQKMIHLQTRGVGEVKGIFDPVHFSFIIASTLALDLPEKQTLLELTSTTERIRKLDTALMHMVSQLEKQAALERRAGTNGHGKHDE
ncbi:MAG: LON peptidase substrate-binding domain-containing protein [Gemmatimonadota bacterium]|nr:LON peptidase substrate-binding domain-containing protein [Gemmatimonadota bacterium]